MLSRILVLAMICSMAACVNQGAAITTGAVPGEANSTAKGTYVVTVITKGVMAMSYVDVYIYEDSDTGDLKKFAKTNENGQAIFEIPMAGNDVAVLSGVNEGYDVQTYDSFSGNACTIILKSGLIMGESYDLFQLVSPPVFSYLLDEDGYYRHDLGKDAAEAMLLL